MTRIAIGDQALSLLAKNEWMILMRERVVSSEPKPWTHTTSAHEIPSNLSDRR